MTLLIKILLVATSVLQVSAAGAAGLFYIFMAMFNDSGDKAIQTKTTHLFWAVFLITVLNIYLTKVAFGLGAHGQQFLIIGVNTILLIVSVFFFTL